MPNSSPRRFSPTKVCAACRTSGAIQFQPAIRQRRLLTLRGRAAALSLGVSTLLLGQAAQATTYTYSGQTGSTTTPATGNFTAGFNGDGSTGYVTPPSGTSTTLAFSGPVGDNYTATDDLSGALTIDGLTFNNAGNITVAQGVGTTLTKGTTTVIALNNTGSLNFGLNFDTSQHSLVFSGTGAGTFSGAISGQFGVTLGGSETVTLSGTSSYTGATTVGAGTTLIVSGSLASTTVGVTGTLQLQATGANTTGTPAVSAAIGGAALTLNDGAALQLRADADTSFAPTSITASAGTVNIDVNQLTASNGNHTLSLGGVKTATDVSTTFNITGGNGDILNFGDVSNGSDKTGIYTTTFNATTAAATIGNLTTGSYGTTAVFSGTNKITLGSLVENSNSTNTLTVSGANLTINGATSPASNRANGGFTVNLNSGTLNINNANVLANPNVGSVAAFNIAGGNLDNTSGAAITETTSTNKITGDFTFNPNSVAGTSHNLTLQGGAGFVGNRTITVNAGTLTISNTSSGSGTYGVTKAGAGALTIGALTIANNSNVQIGANAGTLTLNTAITTGTGSSVQVTAGGGTLALNGLATSAGSNTQVTASSGTVNLGALTRNSAGGTVNFNTTGTGVITTTTNVNGIVGSNASYGSGASLAYVVAGGTSPYTVAAYTGATPITTGATAQTGSGSTNYDAAGSFTVSGSAQTFNTLRYTGSGGDTITIPGGSKLTTAGLMNVGTGTLTISTPSATGQGQGVGAGNGTVGELTVFGNTGGIIFNAPLVNNYNGTAYNNSAVTFATQGTVTLNGLNVYSGATTVNSGTLIANATNTLATTSGVSVYTGAMLSLAANSALFTPVAPTTTSTTAGTAGTITAPAGQVAVGITLNGGTLLRNGAGVSLGSGTLVGAGALTLTATSTLDFGTTGAGTLNFNSFANASNFTLTVTDYNNPANTTRTDGTDDRLVFNEPLTTALLADISFNGTAAMQVALGNGEYEIMPITAVPEPSTWVGGLLCVGAVGGWSLRQLRRRALA